jgi:hypothetical protein
MACVNSGVSNLNPTDNIYIYSQREGTGDSPSLGSPFSIIPDTQCLFAAARADLRNDTIITSLVWPGVKLEVNFQLRLFKFAAFHKFQ